MEGFKFAYHIMFHPFDGFWDMKYEKKGKMRSAAILMAVFIFVTIFEKLVGAFLFNGWYGFQPNIIDSALNVLLPVGLFCVANWSITTLMDGEGRMSEIFMVLGYAMLPMIIIRIPLAIISNFMTMDEFAYYDFIYKFATYWFYFLVFVGVLTVHQFGVFKTVATIIMTFMSMFIIIFLALVFFALIMQVTGFFIAIGNELALRRI